MLSAPWGSGPNQLGRRDSADGTPEAPSSLAVGPDGELLILDQVNGRLLRYGHDGRVVRSTRFEGAAQDLAVARDGTVALLDRAGGGGVRVIAPDGRTRSRFATEGEGLAATDTATAVLVDGSDVYVEREHGPLIRVGAVDGTPAATRPEVPGRPSRDGASYVSAGITDRDQGRFWVNAVDRVSRQHRFTVELRAAMTLQGLVLVDTDRQGTIYVAMRGVLPEAPSAPDGGADGGDGQGHALETTVRLFCLEPAAGRLIGAATLPPNTSPEEPLREAVVLDEGGVLYARRTPEGYRVERYECQ